MPDSRAKTIGLVLSLLLLSSLAAYWLRAKEGPKADEVTISIPAMRGSSGHAERGGVPLWPDNALNVRWRRQGKRYVDSQERPLELAAVERCRREILAAAPGQAGWEETMRLVGVTEKGRVAWRRQLLGRLKWKRFNDTEEAALSLAHLQERARAVILEPDRDIPHEVEIVVSLGGDPPLSVQARGMVHYGMVPWTVRLGGQSWESHSLRIPRALDKLFEDAMIGGPDLMGSPALWEFWRDAALPHDLRGRFSRRVLQVAPQAAEASLLFDCREYQGPGDRILLRQGIIRDWPSWSTVDDLGLPEWDWHFIIGRYKKCLQTAHRQRWLMNWLQAAPDRFLSKPNEGPDLDLSYLDAGDVILDLREGALERGEVALNSRDGSCHILKAVPAKAVHHWFDTLQLNLRAKNGTFAKVFGERVETYTWNSPYGPATRIR